MRSEKRVLSRVLAVTILCSAFAGTPTNAKSTKLPSKVKNVSVRQVNASSVKLSWQKAKNADGYDIYQRVNNNKFKLLKTIKLTKKNSKANVFKANINKLKMKKVYSFKVRAWNKSGKKTVFGQYSSIKKISIKGKEKKSLKKTKKKTNTSSGSNISKKLQKKGKGKERKNSMGRKKKSNVPNSKDKIPKNPKDTQKQENKKDTGKREKPKKPKDAEKPKKLAE